MEKEKLVFDKNCSFDKKSKELIQIINDKWFLDLFNIEDNYNIIANILISVQNTFKEKCDSVNNNTEFLITDKDIYDLYEEQFNGLFEIVDDLPDNGVKILNYLIDILNSYIINAIANGLKNGQISPDDLGD